MTFADLHCHALFGVDDGPETERDMRALVDAAYAGGTRHLCLTPHFHPGYFGDNRTRTQDAFRRLCLWAGETYPDLRLYLGNELRWSPDCCSWLAAGDCRSLNGTGFVLVDFSSRESARTIIRGLEQMISMGYLPVLAHAERYKNLPIPAVRELRRNGVHIQVDAQSLFGRFGLTAKFRALDLLKARLADLVASDAHDTALRPPELDRAYRTICRKYSQGYANALCRDNPLRLLTNNDQEGMEIRNHDGNQ